MLNALVTSSLCSSSDKVSWSFQLFKIYQQYPDSLLRKVMNDLRSNKMVSIKKHFSKNKIKGRNYMPLSNSPYQLSVTFSHKLLSRYQYDIFQQSWQLTKQILHGSARGVGAEVVVGHEGGYAATVVGLMALDRLAFATQVPEQLVVLDPKLSSVDQQYVRIVQRYKELLRSSGFVDQDVGLLA